MVQQLALLAFSWYQPCYHLIRREFATYAVISIQSWGFVPVSSLDPLTAERDGLVPISPGSLFVWGNSASMQALRRVVADTASTDIPVLLIGESGTGKEVLALHIHQLSGRRDEPFIKTRCRSLMPGRLPAQLQNLANGDVSGGLFSGTVFLDDISELEPAGQQQLLDLLSGGDSPVAKSSLTARMISTSRRGLEEDLRAGKFAEELYFRLNGVCLRIPPLRERNGDLLELVDYFSSKYSNLFERPRPIMNAEVLDRLSGYSWPGNIRQLENTIKKIVATSDCDVALADLVDISPGVSRSILSPASSLKAAARAASRQAERELISRALNRTHWNRKRAAQELQISYKALLYKLKQLGLEDTEVS
jgi:two-component system response regulator AtoC